MTSGHRNCLLPISCFAALLVSTSCDKPTRPAPSAPKAEWIDSNQIQVGPVVHEQLSPELLLCITNVHATFADVDGTPLQEWIDDFKRDRDPEANVRIWEDMQVAYKSYCQGRDLPLEIRKEVFKVVLFRSLAPESEVLARIELEKLSQADARDIMRAYPSEPKPIDVIRSDR